MSKLGLFCFAAGFGACLLRLLYEIKPFGMMDKIGDRDLLALIIISSVMVLNLIGAIYSGRSK